MLDGFKKKKPNVYLVSVRCAVQWFKVGDFPNVVSVADYLEDFSMKTFQ